MKLTTKQQEIVQAISDGEITDILSFVRNNRLGEVSCFDRAEVERKFERAYSGKKFLCNMSYINENAIKDRIQGYNSSGNVYLRAHLSFEDAYSECFCNGVRYAYELFEPKYITYAKEEIISFIALWQYLKSQALIMELPKTCLSEDMELFLRKKEGKETDIIALNEDREIPYEWSQTEVPYSHFFNGRYELDKECFEICYPYLTKKIYATPELKIFIQEKYKTAEEINTQKNFRIAWLGVIIAFATSLGSLFVSGKENDYTAELGRISATIQEIQTVIDTTATEENNLIQGISDTLSGLTGDIGNSVELKEIADSLQDILKVLSENVDDVPEDIQ